MTKTGTLRYAPKPRKFLGPGIFHADSTVQLQNVMKNLRGNRLEHAQADSRGSERKGCLRTKRRNSRELQQNEDDPGDGIIVWRSKGTLLAHTRKWHRHAITSCETTRSEDRRHAQSSMDAEEEVTLRVYKSAALDPLQLRHDEPEIVTGILNA